MDVIVRIVLSFKSKFSKKVKLNYIRRNGTKKPSIGEESFNKYKKHFRSSNGKILSFFNYNIIHYGPVNISQKVRISCEATIMVENNMKVLFF